ncbi:Na+/melibiose symporter-like transporter [Evansella vedderi]|uniref:Na+/melibiose symporter-like transporter n=1 Tax=Evansella vedderi TaxID=38282 RepID=A0ABT9ZZP2_9BACI|nr:MFS transporter [Evansella vedderi]MDQ0256708.1 Na+/melibiose symporter-like transporter [Evansella vedderi]
MTTLAMNNDEKYHTAKLWQIGCFALNNTATNIYFFVMFFVSYYATGVAGLTVVVVSTIITFMRVFDGITDPFIGYIIDKTESRFGKFGPLMIIGNIILAGSLYVMFTVTHLLPDALQFIFFLGIYFIHIIGYTFQTACTRAAQTVLTNSPKQRPLFGIFDATYNSILFTVAQMFVAMYLVTKHGGFNLGLFTELKYYAIILSAVFTVFAVIAIKGKDRKEYYGLVDKNVKTSFRDYWPVIKGNRALQMLIVAASTDKLANSMVRQGAVGVMFFGIMLGDYALSGTIGLITLVPMLLITFFGIGKARKIGLKRSFVMGTWAALITFGVVVAYLLMIDTQQISLSNLGFITITFLVLYCLAMGFNALTGNMVIPMIADASDYETYKTGRYVPGMIATIFSFVDKLISSLAPALVGFAVALIGYRDQLPQVGETLTTSLFIMTLVLMFGIPMLGYICSLIAMKFYPLDDVKMEEIQKAIAEIKNQPDKEAV